MADVAKLSQYRIGHVKEIFPGGIVEIDYEGDHKNSEEKIQFR